MAESFIRGNDRLAKALEDPERRARVDAIVAEMNFEVFLERVRLPAAD